MWDDLCIFQAPLDSSNHGLLPLQRFSSAKVLSLWAKTLKNVYPSTHWFGVSARVEDFFSFSQLIPHIVVDRVVQSLKGCWFKSSSIQVCCCVLGQNTQTTLEWIQAFSDRCWAQNAFNPSHLIRYLKKHSDSKSCSCCRSVIIWVWAACLPTKYCELH